MSVPRALELLQAVPDGYEMVSFPLHQDSASCWCRPSVSFDTDAGIVIVMISHKRPELGQFDA